MKIQKLVEHRNQLVSPFLNLKKVSENLTSLFFIQLFAKQFDLRCKHRF